MADKRIFTIQIDGVDKSYTDVVKLLDVLNKIKDVHAKVKIETENATQATTSSTRATQEKAKALTEEEKAEKKLEQTLNRRRQLDTQIAREQINATQSLRERTQELQRSIQMENASSGSIDEKRLQLASLGRAFRALSEEERNAEHIGGAMLTQIQQLREEYNQLERSLGNHAVNVGNYESATQGLNATLEGLSNNVNTMTTATNDLFGSLQTLTGGTTSFNIETKESRALLMGLSKVMALITKLNKSYTVSTQASTAAQEANTVATGTATVATQTFSKALISTGIGALVVGLGLLIANFKDVKKWVLETIPPLQKLGGYIDEFKAIAMGVGNALLQYVLTPIRTVAAVAKKLLEGDIKGAVEAGKNEIKNGLDVISNFEKGYQKEKASQEKEAYLERLRLRQQELEDIIADNEAKLGSDWRYSKEAQKAYKELHNVKLQLNADDLEETKKLERERMSYLREIRERESQSAKDKEAERKKEAERMLSLEKTLQDERLKAIKDEEQREIDTLKTNTQRRLDEIKGNSQTEIDLRKQIEENLATDISAIQDKYRLQREAKAKENADKELADTQKKYDDEIKAIEDSLKKQDLAVLKSYENQEITKDEFNSKMRDNLISSLNEEIKIREKYGESTTDLEIELSKIRIKQAEEERDKVSSYFEDLHKSMQEIVNNVMTGVTAIFDSLNAIMESQLEDAKEKYDAISEKYDEVVEKREESDNRIQELEDEAKNAKGGRLLILQQQINDEMQANTQLASQEKDLAREKEKAEKEIAKKEKQQKKVDLSQKLVTGIANTALGVTEALGSAPPPLNFALAALVGAAGAVQTGLITRQIAKLEDGGLLNGKRHFNGGMRIEGTNIEVEGGEYVINRESTAKNLGLIRYINSQRKELTPDDVSSYFSTDSRRYETPFKMMFETGGQIPNIENTVHVDNGVLVEAIESLDRNPVVSVKDINTVQKNVVRVDDWTDL